MTDRSLPAAPAAGDKAGGGPPSGRHRLGRGPLLAIVLLTVLTAAVAALNVVYRNGVMVEVRHVEVAYPQLPAGLDGFTILLISDLHSHRFGAQQQELLDLLGEEEWNVAVLAGDYAIDRGDGNPAAAQPAAELARGLAARAPCYYVLGNYEGLGTYSYYPSPRGRTTAVLEAAGARPVYPAVRIVHQGAHLWLSDWSRVPYSHRGTPWPRADGFPQAMEDSRDFIAVVTHRPLDLENQSRQTSPKLLPPDGDWCAVDQIAWDLNLSGHTHGGQWRLPLLGPLISNTERGHLPLGVLPVHGDRYAWGVTRTGDSESPRYQVITSGVGESGPWPLRFRILSTREVVLVTLRRG